MEVDLNSLGNNQELGLEKIENLDAKILSMVNSQKDLFKDKDIDEIKSKLFYYLNLITTSSEKDVDKNIVFLIAELIKFIDNYFIEGSKKKEIVISVLNEFLKEKNSPYREYLINNVCPQIINILIKIERKKIILTKKKGCFIF